MKFISRQQGWDIDQQGQMRFLDHVLDLQNFFKLHQIPYVMYNSLPNTITTSNTDLETLKRSIDIKRFFEFDSSQYEFVNKNKLIVSPKDPHPSKEGHEQWAEQLKEHIDANNLRTI